MTQPTTSDNVGRGGRQRQPIAYSEQGNPCAWCLRDAGVKAKPGDSHGICRRHADELTAPARARKEARG